MIITLVIVREGLGMVSIRENCLSVRKCEEADVSCACMYSGRPKKSEVSMM
jgi:hypothetical protein